MRENVWENWDLGLEKGTQDPRLRINDICRFKKKSKRRIFYSKIGIKEKIHRHVHKKSHSANDEQLKFCVIDYK